MGNLLSALCLVIHVKSLNMKNLMTGFCVKHLSEVLLQAAVFSLVTGFF